MNVLLQKQGSKYYKVPEGLRELCSDIAREVLRSQPRNIYCFIAEYVETLLITRENAKVAVKVVNNILLGSQAIVAILYRSGLSLEQIARVAPKIQDAFRMYLDAMGEEQVCDERTCDGVCQLSLQNILQEAGITLEEAENSAKIIQNAFRGHYQRMLQNECQGMVQWQRAATRTLEILKKAGASQAETSSAAIVIQAAYRGYYTRRNLKMTQEDIASSTDYDPSFVLQLTKEKKDEIDVKEPAKTVQAVAWLDSMYEDSGLTMSQANKAATIIQRAYRKYRQTKYNIPPENSNKMVAQAIIKNINKKIVNDVINRADIPVDNREGLMKVGNELRRMINNKLTCICIEDEEGEG